ncbi:efflux RND transporter periplasmic adaptor subunit [Burkholderia ubonensis]|uniref:efflux RND transporter periplasmic adaptor subunit n=1 Tax=Burkholderia ubonensis TaxID=101571 RepID=UPI000757326B|nr:efflux RND transporter periplasmic adaptor subunit [Burkholderia ubonensis]KWC06252.1 hemolysin secretion protein D [Burkholderia ubonensis]
MKSSQLILAGTAMAVVFGGLFLWRNGREAVANEAPPPSPPMSVTASVVRAGTAPSSLDAIGTLVAVRQVMLAPEVAGRITAIHFTPGSQVSQGQALVQLYDDPERAQLSSLQAKAAFAKNQLARSQTLAPVGAEPRSTFDQHQFDYQSASADARQVEAVIRQKLVRAPFAGEIGIRQVNLGQYLNAGDAIATLTDLDTLYANFTLPQKYLGQLRAAQAVHLTADAYPGRDFVGKVTTIEPRVGDATRNVTVQATLENTGHPLRPGMYAHVTLNLPSRPDVLTVPDTAVQSSQDGDTVAVVDKPNTQGVGTVAFRKVRTGIAGGGRVEVLDGLRAGEVVLTAGQVRVAPGARVKIAYDRHDGDGGDAGREAGRIATVNAGTAQ